MIGDIIFLLSDCYPLRLEERTKISLNRTSSNENIVSKILKERTSSRIERKTNSETDLRTIKINVRKKSKETPKVKDFKSDEQYTKTNSEPGLSKRSSFITRNKFRKSMEDILGTKENSGKTKSDTDNEAPSPIHPRLKAVKAELKAENISNYSKPSRQTTMIKKLQKRSSSTLSSAELRQIIERPRSASSLMRNMIRLSTSSPLTRIRPYESTKIPLMPGIILEASHVVRFSVTKQAKEKLDRFKRSASEGSLFT